ncbi:MAG: hypothetical protein ACXABY_21050 [Candidatus Thorarchaeota archaeon]|jgi:ferric iron reductase protein FhuF
MRSLTQEAGKAWMELTAIEQELEQANLLLTCASLSVLGKLPQSKVTFDAEGAERFLHTAIEEYRDHLLKLQDEKAAELRKLLGEK